MQFLTFDDLGFEFHLLNSNGIELWKNWTSKSDTAHLYHGFLWVSKYLFFRFSPYKSLSFLNNFDQNEETKSIVLSFALSNKCQLVGPEERIPIISSKKRQKGWISFTLLAEYERYRPTRFQRPANYFKRERAKVSSLSVACLSYIHVLI